MSIDTGTIRYVHILLQTLRHLGYKRSNFLNSLGMPIDFMDGSKLRLPLEQISEMWKQGCITADEPALGLVAGKYIHPGDFGVMAHVWMNCSNLKDAYQLKCDFSELMNTALRNKLEIKEDGSAHYTANILNCDAQTEQTLIELDFASILPVGRALVDQSNANKIQLESVSFKHSPKTSLSRYEEIFGCPVEFNANQNKIVVAADVLSYRTYSPDPDLKSALVQTVHNLLSQTLKTDNISTQVAELISKSITRKAPLTLEDVAKKFHISSATLKRKIKEDGLTFSEINKQVKMDMAKEMIRSNILSPSQIAYTLNYSDTTAFHRAFKKWTGVTPENYRKGTL